MNEISQRRVRVNEDIYRLYAQFTQKPVTVPSWLKFSSLFLNDTYQNSSIWGIGYY